MTSKIQFYRRRLPESCISFSSDEGKSIFREALESGFMDCYFNISAQFRTQDEPAFCGLSTLVMVLNALEIDPGRIWKGPWRWYHEDMLGCCVAVETIKNVGITLKQFECLASCNYLKCKVIYADQPGANIDDFRQSIIDITQKSDRIMVVSYSRKVLGQSGDGHFAPIAGYHRGKDLVLILDAARFKYPPHWVSVGNMWSALGATDSATGRSRGYCVMQKMPNAGSLIIFALNDLFNALSISVDAEALTEPETRLLDFIKQWVAYVKIEMPTTGEVMADVARTICAHFCSTQQPPILVLQGGFADMESEHASVISCILSDVNASRVHAALVESRPELAHSFEMPANTKDCCAAASGVRARVEEATWIAMFLLAWPYADIDNTIGAHLRSMVEADEAKVGMATANEMRQLRSRFELFVQTYQL